MLQPILHYGTHFILPLLIAPLFFKPIWWKAYFIMMLGMLIDLDHLIAEPMFDLNRCSIDFHPLHSYYAIAVYAILLVPKKTRIIGIGLMVHIFADSLDCWLM